MNVPLAAVSAGIVFVIFGFVGVLLGRRAWPLFMLGVICFAAGTLGMILADEAACSSKGGVLVKGTCIERSAVIP